MPSHLAWQARSPQPLECGHVYHFHTQRVTHYAQCAQSR
ncbi:Uncharacterised protein [Vibrio cholerae]|nr:Uncharacterised protein [Vibrio cholerae]